MRFGSAPRRRRDRRRVVFRARDARRRDRRGRRRREAPPLAPASEGFRGRAPASASASGRRAMKIVNSLIVGTLPFVPKSLVRIFSSRYVAGETLAEALAVVRGLNREGCMATLDVLGEDVTRLEETEETVDEYVRALDAV